MAANFAKLIVPVLLFSIGLAYDPLQRIDLNDLAEIKVEPDSRAPTTTTGRDFDFGPNSIAAAQLPIWRSSNASSYPNRATNLHGQPFPSLTATQAIGTRGHVLMQDYFLLEKLASFNRERIPERVVHAKGASAFGFFEVTHDVSKYTKAKLFKGIGKRTPLAVRFSTAVGERGTADTAVDTMGFAIKFYTEDGNYDLMGLNVEPFSIRDPMLFVDMNRARKRNPVTNINDQTQWWDFASLRPESALNILQLFSDIGRVDGFRKMDGFAIHAFKFVNAEGQVVFGKLTWKTLQPGPALTYQQAEALAGSNPEYKTQDLYEAIARGDFPKWDMYFQIMTLEQARKYRRNPFDITKPWRVEEFPLIPVGTMVLNRNPTNFFVDNEQIAFAPNNFVPGIEPSPDRMLHARLMAYHDAQRYRLGVNFPKLDVNRPLAPVNTYLRDGIGCVGDNGGGHPNYHPNSFGGHEADTVGAAQVRFEVDGIVDRIDVNDLNLNDPDEFESARIYLERDVGPQERRRMVESIADRLSLASREVRERALNNLFYPITQELGNEVKEAVLRHVAKRERSDKNNGNILGGVGRK